MRLDARPLARDGTLAVLLISALHAYQGVLMLIWPSAVGATTLLGTMIICHKLDSPDGQHFVAAVLLVSAALATYGSLWHVGRARIFFFLIQQFLLFIMAGAGIWATLLGSYLDGTPMAWPHISADQAPMVVLFWIHLFAMLRRCWDRD